MLYTYIFRLFAILFIFQIGASTYTVGSHQQSYAIEKMKDTLFITIIGSPDLRSDVLQVVRTLNKIKRSEAAPPPETKHSRQKETPYEIKLFCYTEFSKFNSNRAALKRLCRIGVWDLPYHTAIITIAQSVITTPLRIEDLVGFLKKLGIKEISIDIDGDINNY